MNMVKSSWRLIRHHAPWGIDGIALPVRTIWRWPDTRASQPLQHQGKGRTEG